MNGAMDEQKKNFLVVHQTAPTCGKQVFSAIGHTSDSICDICGEEGHSMIHAAWCCQALKHKRSEADEDIANIPLHIIPQAILYGIAPAMSPHHELTYWGDRLDEADIDESIQK